MTNENIERLQHAVLDLVLNALWDFPMFVTDDDGTHLDDDAVADAKAKVDALFHRAKTDTWLPEER